MQGLKNQGRGPWQALLRQCSSSNRYIAQKYFCSSQREGSELLSSHQFAPEEEEVVIALGSNIGDRVGNFNRALKLMSNCGIQVTKHASLYESAPAYVTDQPFFLNSAVSARCSLSPHALLAALKHIEGELGRDFGGIR
jgi:2-amino-4-hydroxy-6-hydroxymethyldihydropteridine diphosphokinase/dihydropteroate synthase